MVNKQCFEQQKIFLHDIKGFHQERALAGGNSHLGVIKVLPSKVNGRPHVGQAESLRAEAVREEDIVLAVVQQSSHVFLVGEAGVHGGVELLSDCVVQRTVNRGSSLEELLYVGAGLHVEAVFRERL